jgi:hypothetical protein
MQRHNLSSFWRSSAHAGVQRESGHLAHPVIDLKFIDTKMQVLVLPRRLTATAQQQGQARF